MWKTIHYKGCCIDKSGSRLCKRVYCKRIYRARTKSTQTYPRYKSSKRKGGRRTMSFKMGTFTGHAGGCIQPSEVLDLATRNIMVDENTSDYRNN